VGGEHESEGDAMRHSARRAKRASTLLAVPALIAVTVTTTGTTGAAGPDASTLTAEPLVATGTVDAPKALTSRLAESDPDLLGRTDATPVEVLVKLDYDSSATYTGTVEGLAATSPSVTGEALTGASPAEQAYEGYIVEQESSFQAALAEEVPAAEVVGDPLRTVYGGLRLVVPANEVEAVLAIDGVIAVQNDQLQQPLTDSSPSFIGADALYPQLGGAPNAGQGVIVGVLDTGAWPEHPSLVDHGNLAAPPAKADGTSRACNFGDNPLTPAVDPFVCNNKLIGGQSFLATYLSDPGRANAEPYHTARDSNGHGTHTSTTAAGGPVDEASTLGVNRGAIHGIAPGAWVSIYKVCGIQGCYESDSAAAVQQAILDGVRVINFSISGGTDPFNDPVELAFLDAYAAGVFVSTSAGNEGPGASTANHLSPWTMSVAASTQVREFSSTLTVTGGGGATATFTGASITAGVDQPLPVVLSSAPPYSNALCNAPAPAGLFAGKIVACERGGNARVEKGFNVMQGGAAGMILYNPTLADIESDNHWLPTVHLADGTDLLAFLAANPDATASFTAGAATQGQPDVMAAFSSRGPAGEFIKPDVTAPGVQILAGHTPTPEAVTEGPAGNYFQAIAGTSMSSPHVAGAAALLAALNPNWTPGDIKSALMMTAATSVVKEDLVTPADPFDMGSGRIDLRVAANPGLSVSASATEMAQLGNDPLNAVHLNIPSVNVPVLPGQVTTHRTFTNVSGQRARYDITATTPAGSSIKVSPKKIDLRPGHSATVEIVIESNAPSAQYFGAIELRARTRGMTDLHLPVAFVPHQGTVALSSSCDPPSISQNSTTTCTVTATNHGFTEATVDLRTEGDKKLRVQSASGATVSGRVARLDDAVIAPATLGVPSIAPGPTPGGYLPLAAFGVAPIPIGDEQFINFDIPSFVYNGKPYARIGVNSNGYIVVGGGTSEDNNCCNLTSIPDPARPNNVLAPFWTDLDGTGAPGILAASLTDGVDDWIVVEWQVNVFGTTSNRHFQVWIGVNGTQDISFTYDPAALPANPGGQPFIVGAENEDGSGGQQLPAGTLPTTDLVVTSTEPSPGGSVSYTVTAKGQAQGTGVLTTEMEASTVLGTTIATSEVTITRRGR
jgi:subtilisin family serine protease